MVMADKEYSPSAKILANRKIKWLEEEGKDNDVVITTRARLSRNLQDYLFPAKMKRRDSQKLIRFIEDRFLPTLPGKLSFYRTKRMNDTARTVLMERRLIDKKMFQSKLETAVIVRSGEAEFISINSQDHIHINAVSSGRNIDICRKRIFSNARKIANEVGFAFDDEYGYLTSSPINVGCGFKLSFFCHLPALIITGDMEELAEKIMTAGIAIRGYYGTNLYQQASIFELHNQLTLGITEDTVCQRMNSVIDEVIEAERIARLKIIDNGDPMALDRVSRSLAVLKNAYLLSEEELALYLSVILFGLELGMIDGIDSKSIIKLILMGQPGHLAAKTEIPMNTVELDIYRALMINHQFREVEMN